MAKKKPISKKKITVTSRSNPIKTVRPKVNEFLSTKSTLIIALLMAIVGIGLYAPSHNYEFVYDDDAVIKDNNYVKRGFGGLKNIWTTGYFQGYNENINARAYRPVPLATLAIELDLFDKKEMKNGVIQPNPSIYHKTNLLYYGLTGFFLFLFLAKLLRDYHPILAIMATLLFLAHPIHLEVVANIKSRDTILGFLNYIIAGWLFLKYLDERKIWQFGLAILFYLIGLFSKEEVITTLAVIPLLMYFFRNMKIGKIAELTIPFFAAILFYLVIRTIVITGGDVSNAKSLGDLINPGLTLTHLDNSLLAAADTNEATASRVYVLGHYLVQSFFPNQLLSDYSFSTIPLFKWSNWQVWIALLANLALAFFGIMGLIKRKVYGFAILYYAIGLSIFSNIITTNVSVYNDRFLYNAVFGMCLLVAYGLYQLMKPTEDGQFIVNIGTFAKKNILPLALLGVLLGASIFKIETHLPLWKDRYGLFAHDAAATPTNARMRKNNGGSFARKAVEYQTIDKTQARDYARQAIPELEAGLAMYDRMETGHTHLGNMYIILGELDNAERALKRALEIFPRGHYSKTSLSNVLYRQQKYQESINLLEGMPKNRFTQSDYYLMYLGYEKLRDSVNVEKYRKLAGR
ncbi:MAG: tetratricopeptide (TPR) repeat protein [Paraglaciecola sp.]|jgi:tetratricopeptide (TPR) repeat protein